MHAYVKGFWLPKRGAAAGEYEDASWVGPDGNGDGDCDQRILRVVVADGASESMLAGRWARHLVAKFGETSEAIGSDTGFIAAYQAAVASWDAEVAVYKEDREKRNSPIRWYEEPGLAKGAHSTILAVEFHDEAGGDRMWWTASAIGDSCVFQVRDDKLYRSFPMNRADDFDNQPALLSSRAVSAEKLSRHIVGFEADCKPEDSFYLVTDALAAWFLRAAATGQRPWVTLSDLDTDGASDFSEWVGGLRDTGDIKDDDTTLIRVDVWQPW